MADLGENLRRYEKAFRQKALALTLVAGLVLLVVGTFIGVGRSAGSILVGTSTSLIAAVVFAYLAFAPNDLLDHFLDNGLREVFANRRSRCTTDFWLDLIAGASEYYKVLGVANHGYISTATKKEQFTDAFRSALVSKPQFRVEILWLDPRGQLAEIREKEEGRKTRRDTVDSIQWMWDLRQDLPEQARERLSMYLYTETPTCGITWAASSLVVTHYQARSLNLEAPGMILTMDHSRHSAVMRKVKPELSHKYQSNYSEVLSKSVVIDAGAVSALVDLRETYDASGLPSEADVRAQREAADGA
ncbi:MAG: hypothetical protein QOI10_3802 [Solirubrobacterales bacterium]|nr:hypothetical protein [Solirubrobacterales bacterium]